MNLKELRKINLDETSKKIKESFSKDLLIIRAIHNLDELIKVINKLMGSLREWYSYYYPELIRNIQTNEEILDLILSNKKRNDSIGYDFNNEDLDLINNFAKSIKNLYSIKQEQENYIDRIIKEICPKLSKITETLVIARLIEKAGSLKNLAQLPSSTIQVLGAETSFFKGLKTKKSPKFGVVFSSSLVVNARKEDKSKIARKLSNKIALAARQDYYGKH